MLVALNATAIRTEVSGGLEGYALNLSAALGRRSDLRVVLFASSALCEGVRLLPGGRSVDCVGIEAADSSRVRRILWEQAQLPGEVRTRGVRLLHSLTYVSPLFLRRVPNVVTIPDLLAFRFPEYVPVAKRVYWQVALPMAIKRSMAVIAISEFTRHEICDLFPGACDKVHVTRLGIDERLDSGMAGTIEPGRQGHKPALCVGGLGLHKNTETVLRGLSLHRELWGREATPPLVVVGRDYGARSRLECVAKDLQIDDLVEFTGPVTFAQLGALYRACSVLFAVSQYEGFGLPALEALSHGLPVVVARGGALEEVVGEAGQVVDGRDPRAIACALEKIRRDEAGVSRLSQAGRRRAREFTWDLTADATVQAYRSALQRTC